MCGIAGIFAYSDQAPPVAREELLRIRDYMERRGPDGAGLWMSDDERVGLAHRRLAVIDLTPGGAQPMESACGRYQITFNGEIYNYRELKAELEHAGATFRSQSDTEVLLQLYAREGAAMLPRLRGMFAFGVWDSEEQSLFLARDTFGIKPMYYADDGRSLRFASQVKALVAGGGVDAAIDSEGECEYWIWGHIPEPLTIYHAVRSLEAGSWVKIRRGGARESARFESVASLLSPQAQREPFSSAKLHDVLLDSVRHHLIADVPVGVFLSAGIDSATLAALAAESGYRVRTLTLGFEEFRGTARDETPVAAKVAKAIGSEHETHWITRRDFEEAVEGFLHSMDQPSIDGLNTWLISRAAARAGLKVVISGLGGDEFFGGYPSFRHVPLMRRVVRPFAAIPFLGTLTRQLAAPLVRQFTNEKFAGLLEYGSTWQGAYMLRRAMRMPWQLPPGRVAARFELPSLADDHLMVSNLEATRYMRNQLLRDSDWASMAHSIELRVPLVDREVTRHVAAQRAMGRGYTKLDLAASSSRALPACVTSQPKRGFVLPQREWLMARDPRRNARGLLDWSRFIYQNFTGAHRENPPAHH